MIRPKRELFFEGGDYSARKMICHSIPNIELFLENAL